MLLPNIKQSKVYRTSVTNISLLFLNVSVRTFVIVEAMNDSDLRGLPLKTRFFWKNIKVEFSLQRDAPASPLSEYISSFEKGVGFNRFAGKILNQITRASSNFCGF